MWLLTLTICLSDGGSAECQTHSQVFADVFECRKIGAAQVDYVKTADVPGVEVIFAGGFCTKGLDG